MSGNLCRLFWLVSKPPESACLCFSGITSVLHYACFLWEYWGIKLRSSGSHDKHLTNWAMSLSPCYDTFIIYNIFVLHTPVLSAHPLLSPNSFSPFLAILVPTINNSLLISSYIMYVCESVNLDYKEVLKNK